MKSLKIAAVTTIAFLITAVAMAQDNAPKAKGKGTRLGPISRTMLRIDRIKTAVEGLDLNDEQKDKLCKIRDDFEAKKGAVIAKIGDVLTDEQKQSAKEAFDKDKSEKKARAFYQSLEASLKLTDEQKQKLEPIGKELQSLVSDTLKQVTGVLTSEQKEKLQPTIAPRGKKGKTAEK